EQHLPQPIVPVVRSGEHGSSRLDVDRLFAIVPGQGEDTGFPAAQDRVDQTRESGRGEDPFPYLRFVRYRPHLTAGTVGAGRSVVKTTGDHGSIPSPILRVWSKIGHAAWTQHGDYKCFLTDLLHERTIAAADASPYLCESQKASSRLGAMSSMETSITRAKR